MNFVCFGEKQSTCDAFDRNWTHLRLYCFLPSVDYHAPSIYTEALNDTVVIYQCIFLVDESTIGSDSKSVLKNAPVIKFKFLNFKEDNFNPKFIIWFIIQRHNTNTVLGNDSTPHIDHLT